MFGDTKLWYGLPSNGVNSPKASVKTVLLLHFSQILEVDIIG